jgi:2-succinyl-5-enolpyruvyl-6-hydroxy-3-cyclohexene-1-carboxylate synthase
VEAGLGDAALRFWTTPHGTRFEGLAGLFRISYAAPTSLPALNDALATHLGRAGCTVLEVHVPPHGAKDLAGNLAARVDAKVSPLLSSLHRR